ncbi:hypothetical protein OSSY52_09250 [Tepiditoga spiralis]|uniref:Anti-sigma factor antagonist n=1 Tax=Tepiditoga spiralis TaxID=2108365 RepID=A0A7G1G6M0_9BACT|nr:STAS domain-containing protein [Tepiditoga spiralis]BBE30784.1 hypothetical protein OSSY52_09250 [Tepiditoga spiralis]
MDFNFNEVNGRVQVKIIGDMDVMGATMNKNLFFEKLKQYEGKEFDIDMSKVNYIDSTGIGFLISVYREAKKLKSTLIFSNFNENVFKVLKMTNLDKALPIKY